MSDVIIRPGTDELAFAFGVYVMCLYARAATNLYGMVTLEELAEIVNEYRDGQTISNFDYPVRDDPVRARMPHEVVADDVVTYLHWNGRIHEYVEFIKPSGTIYVVSLNFMIENDGKRDADWEDFGKVLYARTGKPRYKPTLTEFVSYGGVGEMPPILQEQALYEWLMAHGIDKKPSRDKLVIRIRDIIADDWFDIYDVINVVDNILVKKKLDKLKLTIKELNELLQILSNIVINTRRWENYGHTPAEMVKLL